jgi:hypothetical protein
MRAVVSMLFVTRGTRQMYKATMGINATIRNACENAMDKIGGNAVEVAGDVQDDFLNPYRRAGPRGTLAMQLPAIPSARAGHESDTAASENRPMRAATHAATLIPMPE